MKPYPEIRHRGHFGCVSRYLPTSGVTLNTFLCSGWSWSSRFSGPQLSECLSSLGRSLRSWALCLTRGVRIIPQQECLNSVQPAFPPRKNSEASGPRSFPQQYTCLLSRSALTSSMPSRFAPNDGSRSRQPWLTRPFGRSDHRGFRAGSGQKIWGLWNM